ncbi:MAG: hypothetical protein MI757_20310, partial [Pirellulales bacterium]|nr:hypothetical protein [Pirellulales bacterium]
AKAARNRQEETAENPLYFPSKVRRETMRADHQPTVEKLFKLNSSQWLAAEARRVLRPLEPGGRSGICFGYARHM